MSEDRYNNLKKKIVRYQSFFILIFQKASFCGLQLFFFETEDDLYNANLEM